ncbi:hypothetical protein [Microbacterium capsulatum]|uniref:ANTAR domain-containing protein n=1 Tax=Microbacterium capsulatum TaxID=3041921 RepID=A0ABU0XF68_9MICO|nr:hypothetical protein [Microbacterium sp. ASV81]MDQ4213747.1 hypothetical protein [Microbacterium sp. ASV81]
MDGQISWAVTGTLWTWKERVMNLIIPGRRAHQARLEAELDRKQDEMRRTILQLAAALGMESHEARRALIRESFLASGGVPPRSD